MTTTRRLAVAVSLALFLLPSCTFSNLDFTVDRRVSITSPDSRATVDLPMEVTWNVHDFDVSGPTDPSGAGFFVVLLDQPPQPPGKPISWFARDDGTCDADPSCPDKAWFVRHHIHPVHDTRLRLDTLPIVTGTGSRKERHELTIVLVDDNGRRIGETAFTRTFFIQRGTER